MTAYRTILACLSDSDSAEATLGLALMVGQAHQAHVEAIHVRPDPAASVPLIGEGMSGAMVEEMMAAADAQATERASRVRAQFAAVRERCNAPLASGPAPEPQFSVSWREEAGREEEVLANAGRLTDLVVFAHPDPDRDSPSIMSLNAVLMESGRPLLLAPAVLPLSLGRRVAVFWNGSVEASRAVLAARPMLKKAETVMIFSAIEGDQASPAELAGYLAWHGVKADVHSFSTAGHAGPALLKEAGAMGCDLIVMGAYTHSRLRQLILGGVTRHVLHAAQLPVLLCH
ncbi:MAG TPA: universal stress protein [Rhodospirillaceae bacterium]|nr:universal stress protein [Rhodospirillaceae bacterium]